MVKKDGEWGDVGRRDGGEGSERLASAALLSPQQSSARAMTTILVGFSPYCLLFLSDLCFNLGICFFSLKQTKVDCFYNCHTFKRKRSLGTQNKRAVPSKISDSLS